jgi:ubiquinone/menaquinone biosynthesis C-methylase UbiE
MRRPAFIARQAGRPTGLLGRVLVALMARETRALNEEVLGELALTAGERVLEVGFGHGRTLLRAATLAPGAELAGIDVSPEACKVAARAAADLVAQGRLELRTGSSAELPWPDASFDKAYSVHTIYFWDDPARHLRELCRVLRSHGLLLVGFRERSEQATADFPPPTYRFLSREEVAALLGDAGFDAVEVAPATAGRGELLIARATSP